MKKLITLLLLFTITLFYSIPTQAYTIPTNYEVIPGLTLTDLFDNNVIAPTTSGWTATGQNISIVNDRLNIVANSSGPKVLSRNFTFVSGDLYYFRIDYSKLSAAGSTFHRVFFGSNQATLINNNTVINNFYIFYTNPSSGTLFQYIWYPLNANDESTIGNIYIINITNLGLTANTDFIEQYYQDYKAYINYTEGYDDGELDGYADGLQDNTAYVKGYNVGYTDGLLGGSDMETGSSLLILIVALIGFVMMIFGFTTKRGIFNLLSVAAFVVLGGLLIEFVGFIIITFGLVLINIYYAFFGEL
jgi:hypothetical protein